MSDPLDALLWEACRRDPRTGTVRGLLARVGDPARVADAAVAHRIAALLWRALRLADAEDGLGPESMRLRSIARVLVMQEALLLPRVLSMALVPLHEGGMEPVVIKGPALLARYPEPGLRPMIDVDLLLPRAQQTRALRQLGAGGWQLARPASHHHHEAVLVHPMLPGLALELHGELETSHERSTALDLDDLWNSRVPIECLGVPAHGLPPEEEMVVLAAHAGKPYHGFERLMWIADLAMLTGDGQARGAPLDWDRIARLARRGRCVTVVAAALTLAGRAGAEVPPELTRLPERGWRGSALDAIRGERWPTDVLVERPFHLRFALVDGPLRRARVLAGSGHSMGAGRRLRWSAGVPAETVHRLLELRRRPRGATPSTAPAGPASSSERPVQDVAKSDLISQQ